VTTGFLCRYLGRAASDGGAAAARQSSPGMAAAHE